MKQTALLLMLAFTTLTASECKKPKPDPNSDNGLPPATQTGQGVFACKVNGQPWISERGLRNMGGGLHGDTLSAFGSMTLEDESIELFQLVLSGTYDPSKQVYQLNDTSNAYIDYLKVGGRSVSIP